MIFFFLLLDEDFDDFDDDFDDDFFELLLLFEFPEQPVRATDPAIATASAAYAAGRRERRAVMGPPGVSLRIVV
ncbi:hypothetical protein [Streptomyces albofaciens]|uniref:hypothetical protein n=1 Tax=Streptomyces albofaciens TaxID=66866 RepID=UPI001FCA9350|nr:hypothetical protein [Streptomyces albofaciens]